MSARVRTQAPAPLVPCALQVKMPCARAGLITSARIGPYCAAHTSRSSRVLQHCRRDRTAELRCAARETKSTHSISLCSAPNLAKRRVPVDLRQRREVLDNVPEGLLGAAERRGDVEDVDPPEDGVLRGCGAALQRNVPHQDAGPAVALEDAEHVGDGAAEQHLRNVGDRREVLGGGCPEQLVDCGLAFRRETAGDA